MAPILPAQLATYAESEDKHLADSLMTAFKLFKPGSTTLTQLERKLILTNVATSSELKVIMVKHDLEKVIEEEIESVDVLDKTNVKLLDYQEDDYA